MTRKTAVLAVVALMVVGTGAALAGSVGSTATDDAPMAQDTETTTAMDGNETATEETTTQVETSTTTDEAAMQGETTTDDESSSGDIPGFGVPAALAALTGAALLARRR